MLEEKDLIRLGHIYRKALLLSEREVVQIKEARNQSTDVIIQIGRKYVLAISEIEGKWKFEYGRRARYVSHGVWKMVTINKKRRKINLCDY